MNLRAIVKKLLPDIALLQRNWEDWAKPCDGTCTEDCLNYRLQQGVRQLTEATEKPAWTTELPTRPGYYFVRMIGVSGVTLVWIQQVPVGLRIRDFGHPTGWPLHDQLKEGYEWQGPLTPED